MLGHIGRFRNLPLHETSILLARDATIGKRFQRIPCYPNRRRDLRGLADQLQTFIELQGCQVLLQ
jgi:hypothetical protein